MNNLLPLPVLLPMFGAALTLLLGRRPRLQRLVSIGVLGAVCGVAGLLMYITDTAGVQALWVGAWAPLGIVLVADRLAALMLTVASLVTLGVLIYATGQDTEEVHRETPVSIFHPTFLLLSAGVSNAFLAGDLFNLFVGFELLLFASYVLLTMGGTGERISAGSIYVVINLVSSLLFLTALAVTYAATGTVNLAQLQVRFAELPADVTLAVQLLLLVVFAIKAAVFPLSFWLPDSYPTAPAPVTAVFAGLLTKVGVYAILRTQTVIFPDRPLTDLLGWAALATMVIGILGAVAQSELKRLLSFTLVSHIGYMIFGIALATQAGLAGAIFYTAHHISVQAGLFLVAGLVQRVGGSTALDRLGGLAALSPLLGVLFFVPAMNLAGVPPMSGFVGKLSLLTAGVAVGTPLAWALVAGGVLTSLLTLYAVAKVWNRAFWSTPPLGPPAPDEADALRWSDPDAGHRAEGSTSSSGSASSSDWTADDPAAGHLARPTVRLPRVMVAATAALVLLGLALAVCAGPLYDYVDRAAADLLGGAYLDAVMAGVGQR